MTPAVQALVRAAREAQQFIEDIRDGRAIYRSQHDAVLVPRRLHEAIHRVEEEGSVDDSAGRAASPAGVRV